MRNLNWEGLGSGGGLLLSLERAGWPLHAAGVLQDGLAFQPKRELHVTLLTRAQARVLAGRGLDVRALQQLAAGIDWMWRPLPEAWLLRRARDDGRVQASLVLMLEMPAQARLRAALATHVGLDLGEPAPHVTLYTHGDATGISLPDRPALSARAVRTVDARSLFASPLALGWRC
jgi:hypothetical protein